MQLISFCTVCCFVFLKAEQWPSLNQPSFRQRKPCRDTTDIPVRLTQKTGKKKKSTYQLIFMQSALLTQQNSAWKSPFLKCSHSLSPFLELALQRIFAYISSAEPHLWPHLPVNVSKGCNANKCKINRNPVCIMSLERGCQETKDVFYQLNERLQDT